MTWNSTLRYIPQSSKKQVFEQVHVQAHSGCIIHNIQKMEIAQMFSDKWMNKQVVVYMYSGILFINKREWRTDTYHEINELPQHYVKWEKPDPKGHILYGSIIFTWNVRNMQIHEDREQVDGCWELRRTGKRNCLLSKGLYFDFFIRGLQTLVSQPKTDSTEWKHGALTTGLPGISLKAFTMVRWRYSRTIQR